MAFIQLMCAPIGMVTGRGLAGALRQRCPRWLSFIAAAGQTSSWLSRVMVGLKAALMFAAVAMFVR
jgi:hypothetical protein